MFSKVVEVNLEAGSPNVTTAIAKMKNALTTCKGQGCKVVILIHGYGSTGVGGSIKSAVIRSLGEAGMRGIVKAFVGGEQWFTKKREFKGFCKSLENYERKIDNNNGVTVVALK